ncbi:hypothetical protein WSS_A38116 [Rhodococcus opacus M213]|uniref:Pyridoxal biosynthesis lyase PdxS n=1 Tax=Rhodococcus opacus M213 TaxID=1129896 RepID=K8X6U8_RHOOP|nr:hypothetical protein WSS_A38116 [Rhodococcus opacus M213]
MGNQVERAAAIVKATTFHDDPDTLAKVSRGLGEAMVGINIDEIRQPHRHAVGEPVEMGRVARTRPWGLARSILYLTDRLDADPITDDAIEECRRHVTAVDQLTTAAKDLPELRHPDAEILGLLARYMAARFRILALA